MYGIILLVQVILFKNIFCVDAQICTKREIVPRYVTEKYYRTVRESYWGNCDDYYQNEYYEYGACRQYRNKRVEDVRGYMKDELQIRQYCCDGYLRDDNYLEKLVCNPICIPECKNGICSSPGVCTCNASYEHDSTDSRNCVPICTGGCQNGVCVAPDYCQCNYGYSSHNNTYCAPICTSPCFNGVCTAPDTCTCKYGYIKLHDNTCVPHCLNGCEFGICVDTDTCECLTGYQLDNDKCEPVCSIPCGNGTCVRPEQCECFSGYELNNSSDAEISCQPVCDPICRNGKCDSPGNCTCDEGYIIDTTESNTCVPHCEEDCSNGRCVRPNTCECDTGYIRDNINNSCKPICSTNCTNGTCIEPEVCECWLGFENYNNSSACMPFCSISCEHGQCLAPDVCHCDTGYILYKSICTPKCTNHCGHGMCIAPNICECESGYTNTSDVEPTCKPICEDCQGICVTPNVCRCDPRNESIYEEINRKLCDCLHNCTEDPRICIKTICHNENGSYEGDDIEETTSNDINITFNDTMSSYERETFKLRQESYGDKKIRWIYVTLGGTALLLMVIIAILMVKRKVIYNYFRGGSYAVKDSKGKGLDDVKEPNVRFSAIEKRRIKEC